MKSRKVVLITGAAGYIGSTLSQIFLQHGYEVRGIDVLWFDHTVPMAFWAHPSYTFRKGDFGDATVMRSLLQGVDIVFHTAAVVGEPACKKFPELAEETNYHKTLKLVEYCEEFGVPRFVFFSTCSNYGISEGIADENAPLQPLSLYARTKVAVERFLMERSGSLQWVIGRLATVYGVSPRMRFDLTVNDFTAKGWFDKYIDIFLPHTYRPYVHVYDVARIMLAIAENFDRVSNQVFNVGFEGENYQKITIAEMVKKYIPEVTIEIVREGTDLRDYQVSFDKLQRSLPIENQYTVESGVQQVLTLFQQSIVRNPKAAKYYDTEIPETSEA